MVDIKANPTKLNLTFELEFCILGLLCNHLVSTKDEKFVLSNQ